MGRYKIVSVLLSLFFCSFLAAQQSSEFEQWKKQNQTQFQQYVSEQDKAFSSFLKQKWVKADVTVEHKKPEQPKLPTAPIAPIKKSEQTAPEQKQPELKTPIQRTQALPELEFEQEPVIEHALKSKTAPKAKTNTAAETKGKNTHEPLKPLNGQAIQITFLGHTLSLPKSNIKPFRLNQPNGQAISDAWLTMSQSNSADIVNALQDHQQQLNLDDWGIALLVHEYVKKYQTNDSKTSVLQSWFYLVKLGLNARIAYNDTRLFLLLNTNHSLYAQKYFSFGAQKFYFVDFSGADLPRLTKVSTYQKQHQSAVTPVSIDLAKMPTLPNIKGGDVKRNLAFNYNGEQFRFDVDYHSAYIEFLSHYPQVDVKHYFATQLSDATQQSLLTPLAEIIKGRSEIDSLNILLRFVQKALAYQTDDQQFNKEKFMFATEALHFPYADCEDRSVLFSYLVQQLMGNTIIGVLYKGHIATAVKVESDFDGAHYSVNGEKYFVADPTYIGADLGEVMPGYESQAPKMIRVN